AVEKVDRQPVAPLDRLPGSRKLGIGRVAKRALPEADVADRNVEIAREPCEVLRLRVVLVEQAARKEAPSVENGDSGTNVSESEREVDRVFPQLGDATTALGQHPLVVDEADLLRRIVQLRGNEQRPKAGEE